MVRRLLRSWKHQLHVRYQRLEALPDLMRRLHARLRGGC